jgi:hypothetical protein
MVVRAWKLVVVVRRDIGLMFELSSHFVNEIDGESE